MNKTELASEEIEFISFDEVQQIIPMSKSRLYTLMSEGRFPRPVKIGEHRAVWIKHEIIAYRAKKIAERDAQQDGQTSLCKGQ